MWGNTERKKNSADDIGRTIHALSIHSVNISAYTCILVYLDFVWCMIRYRAICCYYRLIDGWIDR